MPNCTIHTTCNCDPDAWSGGFAGRPKFDRGFTGHEHLYGFGLINMNGRMYDPVMSGFLSPDNYIQAPDFSQSFNRYAYCLNNPLRYVDPSGEIAVIDDIIIAAFIGGMINTVIQGYMGNINSAGDFALAFGIGAASGAVGAWAGGAAFSAAAVGGFQGGFAAGMAGGAAGGFIGGAGNSWMNGASFGDGLLAGCNGAIVGAMVGGVTGGLSRGIVDCHKGYNFLDGTKTVDFPAPNTGSMTINEAYPNIRNFSGFDQVEPQETAWLQQRTSWSFGFTEGEMGVTSLTTQPPKGFIVDPSTGFFIGENGRQILGRATFVSTGLSEVQISPFASTHASEGVFRAVVGHELTHAYHFFTMPEVNGLYSERAALDYSYMEYYRAGYSDLLNTISTNHGYPSSYYVPKDYEFSTIKFFEQLRLKR